MLRALFGPSKDEIWSQVAEEIGGDYIDGGFWGHDALVYEYGEWTFVLDTYTIRSNKTSTTYTRMRAPFVNQDGLYFKIYREGFFSSLGRFFGMQDIEIGHSRFDDDFVIKGNSEEQIRLFLNDEELKKRFLQQPQCLLEIRDDEGWFGPSYPEGVDELYFSCIGIIRDVSVLKNLFELFSLSLERLVQIDSAYEDDPRVKLI